MHRVSFLKRMPHLYIVVVAVLVLVIVYAIKFAAYQLPARALSAAGLVISPPGGYYEQDVWLEIVASDPNAQVIFTIDGGVPEEATAAIYTQPILLCADEPTVTVVRARAVLPSGELGPVVSASYFVGVQATLPLMSLVMDPDDLWGPEGIYDRFLERGDAWERPVDVTYVDKDRLSGFHIPAGIRIHGANSRYYEKKPLRLYFRQEYGVSRLEYPLFVESETQSFKRLVLHTGAQDWAKSGVWHWTLMRSQLADRLALEVGGLAVHNQPTLLFINGKPWGIYNIRERIDRHFLTDYYGVERADLLESPENVEQAQVLMGDREHWDHLMLFLETHDLTDSANYAYIQNQVDIANFIDYHILKIYMAGEESHNVLQLRPRVQGGRWNWMFWDSDHSFGALPDVVDTDTMAEVLMRDFPETDGRDMRLFRKLAQNPDFLNRFLSRAADLLNTTLAPGSVIGHIDDLSAQLEPDIAYETVRWGSTGSWTANVEEMRKFARLRPDLTRQHIVEGFGLDGTAELVVNSPSSGSGTIAINGSPLQDLPWKGIYFQGVPVRITAVPMPGYRFAGWDSPGLPQTPVVELMPDGPLTLAPRFEAIDDDAPQLGDVAFSSYSIDEDGHVDGGWFELQVMHPGGVDLRGWRVTDNDTKIATDEGSLVFDDSTVFAHIPHGTVIRIVMQRPVGDRRLPHDDLGAWDRRMTLYVGNPNLDVTIDPGFNLGPNDNLVLLAPGLSDAFEDDVGIAFVANGGSASPASFGVLADGVLPVRVTGGTQLGPWTREEVGGEKPIAVWLFILVGLTVLCLFGFRLHVSRL